MPELPEVETVRRGLEQAMVGRSLKKVILRRENLRFPFPEGFCSRVEGLQIDSIRRRAKYLFANIKTDGRKLTTTHTCYVQSLKPFKNGSKMPLKV